MDLKRVGSSDGISGEPTIYIVLASLTVIKRKKVNKILNKIFFNDSIKVNADIVNFSKINQKEILQINQKYRQEYLNKIDEIFSLIEKPVRRKIENIDYFYMIVDRLFKFPSRILRKLLK